MNKHNTKKRFKKLSRKVLKSKRKTRKLNNFVSKKRNNHKYYYGGLIIDESIQIQNRDRFRAMFIPNLKLLKNAVETNNPEKIEQAVDKFRKGFTNQKMGINLRILASFDTYQPIDKTTYSLRETGNIALFPCLVIIYENISDTKIRKKLTESFIKNGGNINLQSNKGNVTALSDAIKLQDKSLIQLLLNKGASIETLNEQQKLDMDSILKPKVPSSDLSPVEESSSDISPIIETAQEIIEPDETKTKLIIPTELPPDSGYPIDVEPEFWIPLFGANNMFSIREKIRSMMASDMGIKMNGIKISDIWSVCKIIQNLIPTYFVSTENKPYQPQGEFGPIFLDSPTDFSQYNIILCASLLIFGIISQKMKYQDYQLIFKGGKAIQLVLAKIPGINMYESEDIDVLLMPKQGIIYDEILIKNLSGHIAYLIKWFLTVNTPVISVLVPNPSNKRANPFIFKLSYIKQGRGFKAFSDIDFREIPQTIKPYFERAIDYTFNILELEQRVSFKCPDIGSLLDEKLYYYAKYTIFKDMLTKKQTIPEPDYATLTIDECIRLLDKFKRAIINLNKGLQIARDTELSGSELESKEIKSITNRFKKLNITDPNIQTLIIQGLYPNTTIKP